LHVIEIKTENTKPGKLITNKKEKCKKISKFRRLYFSISKGDGRKKLEKYHDNEK
jgi:hypothetical protein